MANPEPKKGGVNPVPLKCPACDQNDLKALGSLPKMFGVFKLITPGNLYACPRCFLFFRHPYPSESEIENAYRTFASNGWADSLKRVDFDMAVDFISKTYRTGNIMDVGCYDGEWLKRLPGGYQKYGVELSIPARNAAQQHGIVLVGTSINDIEVNRPMFHAITLMDVIEHLPRPLDALKRAANLLLPGGVVIVSTGNTDALLWKFMRRDYWYYYPEHVTFTNHRWFMWVAEQLDLEMVLFKKIPHRKGSVFEKWRQLMNCVFYKVLELTRPYEWLYHISVHIYPFNRVKNWSFAPLADLMKDHMFIVLKSKSDP